MLTIFPVTPLLVVYLHGTTYMKKIILFGFYFLSGILIISCAAQPAGRATAAGIERIIVINPEVYPDIPEVKPPTYVAFMSAFSDKIREYGQFRLMTIDTPMIYDSVDTAMLTKLCDNNRCDLAVVPKVKYFKVGLGKFVFSNQVVISMKLYDKEGNMLAETSYDTYRGHMRLTRSAESSIKLGVEGALEKLSRELRSKRPALPQAS